MRVEEEDKRDGKSVKSRPQTGAKLRTKPRAACFDAHCAYLECIMSQKKKGKKGKKNERGKGEVGKIKTCWCSVELDDVCRIEPFCIRMHWPPVYTCLAPHHYYAHKLQSLSVSSSSNNYNRINIQLFTYPRRFGV